MVSAANGGDGEDDEEEEEAPPIYSSYRAEIDETLRRSLLQRTESIKQQVAVLTSGAPPPSRASQPVVSSKASQPIISDALQQAAVKALREACLAARPVSKNFGPTRRQSLQVDPPEPDEEVHGEGATLSTTLESLERNIGSRRKQIASLRQQADVVKQLCGERETEVGKSNERHRQLQDGGLNLQREHAQILERLRSEIKELSHSMEKENSDAARLEKLARQQTRFFVQSKQIARIPGGESVAQRSQAGELATVPMPPPLADEPEHDKYDVGTAEANPYVVDSWPFEANVLKTRTSKEVPMPPLKEETVREMQDEMMRQAYRCTGLPVRDDESEDEDDDLGPTTARSM